MAPVLHTSNFACNQQRERSCSNLSVLRDLEQAKVPEGNESASLTVHILGNLPVPWEIHPALHAVCSSSSVSWSPKKAKGKQPSALNPNPITALPLQASVSTKLVQSGEILQRLPKSLRPSVSPKAIGVQTRASPCHASPCHVLSCVMPRPIRPSARPPASAAGSLTHATAITSLT
jgi:hypothetical protein